jgi:mevalonate kinase
MTDLQPFPQVSAPAKIILFGEHAVVYGQPALAVPVSQLRVTATLEPNAQGGLQIVAADINQVLPVTLDGDIVQNALGQMARLTLEHLKISPPNVTIKIESQIPLASGLGSGAAVSAALGRAIAKAANRELADHDLSTLVYEIERIHHGTPSGVDNTVIVYERPVYFIRDVRIETLNIGQAVYLLIADTGKAALTRDSVGDVRKLYEHEPQTTLPIIQAIGKIAQQARAALEAGDTVALGQLANQNHTLLQQLTVSSSELDHLVDAARNAGALGAKLSGGGRGGNMLAFVTLETRSQVQAALTQAGAVRVISTVVR